MGGVETTTQHACADPRRLGSIPARVVRRRFDGNGSLRPLPRPLHPANAVAPNAANHGLEQDPGEPAGLEPRLALKLA